MSSAVINRQRFRPIFAALSLSLTSCGSATDRILEETFDQLYPIEATANVTIKNGDGTVCIYGSSENEIRVQAVKRAYTPKRLKQIAVKVFVQPDSVSIETDLPKKKTWGLFDRSGTVEYTIVVPRTVNISRLELDNGEILVDGMHGQTVHARLGSGQMLEHNCLLMRPFHWGAARSRWPTIGGSRADFPSGQTSHMETRAPFFRVRPLSI